MADLEVKEMVALIKCMQDHVNSESKNPIKVIEEIRKLPEEKSRILLAFLNKSNLTKEISEDDKSAFY